MKSLLLTAPFLSLSLAVTHAATIVTTPGSPINGGQLAGGTFTVATVGSSGNAYPAAESPPNAIDGVAGTKYLNFVGNGSGYIVTPSIGPSQVNGLVLTTANDGAVRDPLTFSLYGSNTASATVGATFNLTDFTAITVNQNAGLDTDPGRLTTIATLNFPISANYQTFLLAFPTIRTPGNAFQIGNAILVVPEPGVTALLGMGVLGLTGFRRRRRAL